MSIISGVLLCFSHLDLPLLVSFWSPAFLVVPEDLFVFYMLSDSAFIESASFSQEMLCFIGQMMLCS